MTTLEIRTDLLTRAGIRSLERRVTRRNLGCLQVASARALSRVAAKARRDQIDHIDETIDRPVGFTRRGPRFVGADASQPISRQQSAVFIAAAQSRYLQPLLEGEQTTQTVRDKPIVYEPTSAVIRGEVRGRGGVRLNVFGNVPRLASGFVRDLLERSDVFEVPFGSTDPAIPERLRRSPGIYLRRRRGRRGNRTETLIKLFNYRDDSPRQSEFDFTEQGIATFRRNIGPFYEDELRRCLRQRRI